LHVSGGCNVEGEDDGWDFGTGAGFYVDATEEPWKTNYRMFSYITVELPEVIKKNFPINGKQSIMGHRYKINQKCLFFLQKSSKEIIFNWFMFLFSAWVGTVL